MEGTITNYRSGRHTQNNYEMIIKIPSVDSKTKAEKLVSKSVEWANPEGKNKKVIKGTIVKAHGNKGSLRVKFERGMPGRSISTKVKVV